MPANYVLLEKITVGASGATSVTFSGIPQTGYTDLVVKISGRTNRNYGEDQFIVRFNSDTGNNYASRYVQIYDGSVSTTSISGTNTATFGMISDAGNAANSFGNAELYISNYTRATHKPISTDSVTGGNASPVGMRLTASLWSNTAAINSIFLDAANGTEFKQYSSFYLYGVPALGTTPAIAPKATGGDTIMTDGTYWYHAFKASGTFTPATGKNLTCDYLVIAGGGGGTGSTGLNGFGGPGAGGLRSTVTATGGGGTLESAVTLNSGIAYTVTIGAGGAAATGGTTGSNSSLAGTGLTTITSLGGGRKDTTGGSGGGGNYNSATYGLGTAGQGFRGGNGFLVGGGDTLGGGGGGSGAVGADATSTVAGNGGVGVQITAFATPTGTGVSGFYAGGGGASAEASGRTAGTGSSGGGNGAVYSANATSAIANTGSGGGAASSGTGGTGGSGLIIVRYPV